MAGLKRVRRGTWGSTRRGPWARVVTCAIGMAIPAGAQTHRVHRTAAVSPWEAAVTTRARFEATGSHTTAEYRAMEGRFRAIYHDDPQHPHAAKAAEEVAELLAEQGRALREEKALRDAAGQYEWVARAYPGGALAPGALGRAAELFGPEGLKDRVEAERVTRMLELAYPKSVEARTARAALTQGRGTMVARGHQPLPPAEVTPIPAPGSAEARVGGREAGMSRGDASTAPAALAGGASRRERPLVTTPQTPTASLAEAVEGGASTAKRVTAKPLVATHGDGGLPVEAARPLPVVGEGSHVDAGVARLTGIRHWSTPEYTRVVIDLSDEVEYKATQVTGPDRVFFDLPKTTLAAGLAGKSFAVTDGGGLLTGIHAAQSGPEGARVVLDVKGVAQYSAFLLPNPERLIIDVHGTLDGAALERARALAAEEQPVTAVTPPSQVAPKAAQEASVTRSLPEAPKAAPMERVSPAITPGSVPSRGNAGMEVSSLPPMAVTDGSASFGLPPKGSVAGAAAAPRVVVTTKPTAAKPVTNAVETVGVDRSAATVSQQPGKVEATAVPTRKPVVQGTPDWSKAEHYVPRSARGAAAPSSETMAAAETTEEEAQGPAAAPSSLTRALGLKIGRIVIDAGHGGHDSGTLGAGGIEEKDVVLDVALRLGKLLHERMGAEVVYTRSDDTFIPLETRTAIANKAQADLFISVHANSSRDESARGVEVYYLNFTSDPEAMEVAGRENAVSQQSVHQLGDLVKKIALKDKIDESRELAAEVDDSLYRGLAKGNDGLKNRGVKKAPFVVLIGANMPSILAEISFVTNPKDAEQLEAPGYRERVAESLYAGVARYAGGVNRRPVVKTERAAVGR